MFLLQQMNQNQFQKAREKIANKNPPSLFAKKKIVVLYLASHAIQKNDALVTIFY